jgi:hypothetical protein
MSLLRQVKQSFLPIFLLMTLTIGKIALTLKDYEACDATSNFSHIRHYLILDVRFYWHAEANTSCWQKLFW